MMNGLAFRLIGRDSDVDDLVQDTFIEAFTHLGRLRDPHAFGGWLRSIMVHRIGKMLRRRRLLQRLGLGRGALDFDPEVIVSRSAPTDVIAELRALYARIQGMPADLRIALVLRKIEGHSLEEVAELTGASLATVKRRLVRANQHLKSVENRP